VHPLYEILLKDLRTDASQMAEEGHDEKALLAEVESARSAGSLDALIKLQQDLWGRPSPPGFPYEEPDDWQAISSFFPDPDSHARFAGSDKELADRILAGWLGRCAGCQLGKPLEGTMWPDKIRVVLETVGSWPLTDYMNALPEGAEVEKLPDCDFFEKAWKNSLTRGNFDAVSPDDDIHYALVGQRLLEEFGPDFTPQQAIEMHVRLTPYSCVYASGRSMLRTSIFGFAPPYTALYGNPCRQSLGAQIRCDPFGWGAPANPALAASMAYKDAANSQRRNGIYSGMFFAVLLADVLAHGDPGRAVATAAAYVPPRSKFAEMVRLVQDDCRQKQDWEEVNAAIYANHRELAGRFNHSIPNAAIVIMALLKGGGDFTRTVGISVMAGLDTDCNGATAGSIMGCALGTAGIPQHWTAPFRDTIHTSLRDMGRLKISEVAQRMYQVAKENARYAR